MLHIYGQDIRILEMDILCSYQRARNNINNPILVGIPHFFIKFSCPRDTIVTILGIERYLYFILRAKIESCAKKQEEGIKMRNTLHSVNAFCAGQLVVGLKFVSDRLCAKVNKKEPITFLKATITLSSQGA